MGGRGFLTDMLAAVKPLKVVTPSVDYAENAILGSRINASVPAAMKTMSAEANSSLETLFQLHHDRVFRTAHRVTGSPATSSSPAGSSFAHARC